MLTHQSKTGFISHFKKGREIQILSANFLTVSKNKPTLMMTRWSEASIQTSYSRLQTHNNGLTTPLYLPTLPQGPLFIYYSIVLPPPLP